MRLFFSCLFLVSFFNVFSQDEKPKVVSEVKIDSLYREDQFYFSIAYNILHQGPNGLKQDKFSAGLSAGFLRDMPFNKMRTHSVAVGLGLTYQNFFQNLTISKSADGTRIYGVNPYDQFVVNKYRQYSVDLPVEFRWRNSNFENHKFFRIYGGFKCSYVFSSKSTLKDGENTYKIRNNPDINKLQYGATFAAGYNTWNVYFYYGLNKLFKDYVKDVSGNDIKTKSMNVGLMFYIL